MVKPIMLGLALIMLSSVVAATEGPADLHLVVREKNYHESIVAGGPTIVGTIRVGAGELYDESGSVRIGSILMMCANTEVEDGKVKSAYCSGVMKMAKGDLSVQAVATEPEDSLSHTHNYIVTGGTRAYANMRGYGINKFASQPSYQEIFLSR